jgi:hypothetical protein
MSMALKLREQWPDIVLNETHPKVLYRALTGQQYSFDGGMVDWLSQVSSAQHRLCIANDNEWDAAISAWFTLESIAKKSPRDLFEERQGEDLIYPVGGVHYYWPERGFA